MDTPNDFGLRGSPPTHPELLDALAAQFMADGWSLKTLHRRLMLSAAYRQSSADRPEARAIDVDNRWLWRMNARPLEFEAYRDSVLVAAGRLDLESVGGAAVDVSQPDVRRRTLYAFVDRKTLPGLFRHFDFPDPNFSTGARAVTALPPRALFLLNNPFLAANAKALAERVRPASLGERPEAVRKLYRLALQREPLDSELERVLRFLDGYPAGDVVLPEATAWSYGYGRYDAKTGRVVDFEALKQFAGQAVKGTKNGTVDASGLELTPEGGKSVGSLAAVRRWTAPFDGVVNIDAELSHANAAGQGVVCQVVSSRAGLLGSWSAAQTSLSTGIDKVTVHKGDTIDFVSTARANGTSDEFRWSPVISMPDQEMPGVPGVSMSWDAKTHFQDPSKAPTPMDPWEELAQVLLLTDEFAVAE